MKGGKLACLVLSVRRAQRDHKVQPARKASLVRKVPSARKDPLGQQDPRANPVLKVLQDH